MSYFEISPRSDISRGTIGPTPAALLAAAGRYFLSRISKDRVCGSHVASNLTQTPGGFPYPCEFLRFFRRNTRHSTVHKTSPVRSSGIDLDHQLVWLSGQREDTVTWEPPYILPGDQGEG